MQQFLVGLSTQHEVLFYVIIVVLACAEGPWLSLISGVLLKLGYFNFFLIYGALMLGDLIGDVGWYCIGRKFGIRFVSRWGKYFSITGAGIKKVEEVFHKYKHTILLLSKISNGFGFALVTLVTAGMVRIPFWRYMFVNLLGQFVWSGMLIGVGYFFSHLYQTVDSILGRMVVIAGFVILVAAFMGYRKYLKNKVETLSL